MANVKISNLAPATTPLSGAEQVPVVQSGATVRTTVTDIIASRVSAVTASSPLASSGGVTPNLSLTGVVSTTNGGVGQSTYAIGDTVYYASGTSLSKLTIGAVNAVLTSSGTAPQWSTSIALSGSATASQFVPSGSTAPTNGTFLPAANTLGFASNSTERLRFSSAGAWGLSGANYGTSGQVLTSAGPGAAPTWSSSSGGAQDYIVQSYGIV